jgi:hypothetical protein
MSSIYEGAAAVLMWLGEDGDNSHLAMELLLRLENNGEHWIDTVRLPEFRPHLRAIESLMQRDYWERVWIMQEVVLAKGPFLCSGQYAVKWSTLALFLLVGQLWTRIHPQVAEELLPYIMASRHAGDRAATLASLWFQKCLGHDIPNLAALLHSRRRYATDLHDYIFGIACIAKGLPIKVNYNMPVALLYQQLARSTILQDKNLDILSACYVYDPNNCPIMDSLRSDLTKACKTQDQTVLNRVLFEIGCVTANERTPDEQLYWNLASLESLPSWVPRWHHLPATEEDWPYLLSKRNPDEKADAGLPPRVQFLSNDHELAAEGIFFDAIDAVAEWRPPSFREKGFTFDGYDYLPLHPQLRDEWAMWTKTTSPELVSPYGSLSEQQDAFRNTMVLGCFRHIKEERVARDFLLNLYMGWKADWGFEPQKLREVTEKIANAISTGASHRFFTTKWGYMGKGKALIRPGDVVAVLYGGKVPFILRPMDSKYHFLGECCTLAVFLP